MFKNSIAYTLMFGLILGHSSLVLAKTVSYTQPEAFDEKVYRSFSGAALNQDETMIQSLIHNGYDINVTNKKGVSPLCTMVRLNKPISYNLLLKNGADPKQQCMKEMKDYFKSNFCKNKNVVGDYCSNYLVEEESSGVWNLVAGTAVLGGIGVAIAAGGGGGGGGSSSGGGGENPSTPTQESCLAGTYWTGSSCETCAEGSTSEAASTLCVCEKGTWDSGKNVCNAVEQISEKVAACLGGNWDEITGVCLCPEGMSLIGGVCTSASGDDFQDQDVLNPSGSNISLDDTNRTALVAEIGAKATNAGAISGTSDAGLIGMKVSGVSPDAVSGTLTKDSEIDLAYASQANNTGSIHLSHATNQGSSMMGIFASQGATILNSGDIVLDGLSSNTSYGIFAEGSGHSIDNAGNITLNAMENTQNLYGIFAKDRNVINSGTIATIFKDLNNNYHFSSLVAGMHGGTLTNKGIISLDTSNLLNPVGMNYAAMDLERFGTAVNETGGVINLTVKNVSGNIYGMHTEDGSPNADLFNKGVININGSLYADSTGSMSVFGMNQQKGALNNYGTITANLDTTSGGQLFLMKNLSGGDIVNEKGATLKMDLSQSTENSQPFEAVAMSTASAKAVNKGQILITADAPIMNGIIFAMRGETSGTLQNDGLIQIESNANQMNISAFSNATGDNTNSETGVIKLKTSGLNSNLAYGYGPGKENNSGSVTLTHTGSGSLNGTSFNKGDVTLNAKDGIFRINMSAIMVPSGSSSETLDGKLNINLFGTARGNIYGHRFGGSLSNKESITIRTEEYLSSDEITTAIGSATGRSGNYFGEIVGISNEIHDPKDSPSYAGVDFVNDANLLIEADGINSSIIGMQTKNYVFGVDKGDRTLTNNGNLTINTKTDTTVVGMLSSRDDWTNDKGETVFEKSLMVNNGNITINATGGGNPGNISGEFNRESIDIPYSVIGMLSNNGWYEEQNGVKEYQAGAINSSSGVIKINVTGDTRAAGMVAVGENALAVNKGVIEINHLQGGNTSSALGPQLIGCYAMKGGSCKNEGVIRINGTETGGVFELTDNSNSLMLIAQNGTIDAANTQIRGAAEVDPSVLKGTNEVSYRLSGQGEGAFIGNGDYSSLSVSAGSALFNASLVQNETNKDAMDINLTMKSFDSVVDNQSLASFLATNYVAGKNVSFFDMLKSNKTVSSLNHSLNALTGLETLSRFGQDDMNAMREVHFAMNEQLFANDDKHVFETVGSVSSFSFKNDNNTTNQFALINKRISPNVKVGYALSVTKLNTNDENDTIRDNTLFQLYTPISYGYNGIKVITNPYIGFARGHYTREGYANISYNGYLEKRLFGVMNEARYPMDLGFVKFEPSIEFNMVGYNQKGNEEEQAYALTIPSNTNLSVETGIGFYLKKDIDMKSDGQLKLNGGMMLYREFADPYNLKLGMYGMDGTFDLYDETKDYRGVFSFGLDYKWKEFSFYGNFQHFMATDHYSVLKLELGVKF